MTPELARRATVALEWLFALSMIAVALDALVSMFKRRRRARTDTSEVYEVGVSSGSQFTIERLRLLLEGHSTASGKRVRVVPFVSTNHYDSVILDVNRPGLEIPTSIECIGVFDRAVPANSLPGHLSKVVRLTAKQDLLRAIGVSAEDGPTIVMKIVYGILVLMALGLVTIIGYGLVKGI